MTKLWAFFKDHRADLTGIAIAGFTCLAGWRSKQLSGWAAIYSFMLVSGIGRLLVVQRSMANSSLETKAREIALDPTKPNDGWPPPLQKKVDEVAATIAFPPPGGK